jgi:glycine/D-amino acid oxidase-like deaminating enzyme
VSATASTIVRRREGRMKKTSILIAGSGFAGLSAALYLDKTLARRGEAEVTLISRPELHSVHAAGLTRRFAPRCRSLLAE